MNKREPAARRVDDRLIDGPALCAFDEAGAVRGANGSFERLFGVPLAAIVGAPVSAFLAGGFDHSRDGTQDVIGRHRDGSARALVVTVSGLVLDDGTQRRLASIRDLGQAAATRPPSRGFGSDGVSTVLAALGDQIYAFSIAADGSIETTFSGPGGHRLLGGPLPARADLVTAWTRAVHPDDRDVLQRHLARLTNGEETEDAMRLVGLDGVTRWISFRAWPKRADGAIVVHGIAADVTGRMNLERVLKATIGASRREAAILEEARAEAEHQARTDALTGISNRRHLTEVLHATLAAAVAGGGPPPGLVLVDIDHFKRINDTYGHAAGDAVLIDVARRIAGSVRASDCVARWGGEEFCLLLESITDEARLREIAEGVRLRIENEPILHEGIEIAVTASLGAARAVASLLDPDDLADAADRALYAAKRRGRNQTRLYSEWEFEDLVAEDPEAVRIAEALAITATLREGSSPHHPMQVSELALRVAEMLGQPLPVVLRCRLGGWLHDVGKVAIPDRILTKPGPLDDAEWAVMRTHPAIGEEIIRRVAGLKEAVRAVRHHHERWDGAGYPDGLAGDRIPIEARIVAAADAYSAIVSDRPHRPARDHRAAAEELRRVAGSQLDPVVVDALLHVATEVRVKIEARTAGGEVSRERRRRTARHDEAA